MSRPDGSQPDEPRELDPSAARGAKRIFLRFILMTLALNVLVGLPVVIYDVADSVWMTRDFLRETAELLAQIAQRSRRSALEPDAEVVRRAAAVTAMPLALVDRSGAVSYSSDPRIRQHLGAVFGGRVRPGVVFAVRRQLGELSGAWAVSPFSAQHDLLVVVPRHPDQEGVIEFMTIAAGISGLGLVLSFAIMLIAANWMLRRPLSRLISQLTSALAEDVRRRQLAEERAVAARLEAEAHLAFRDNLIDSSEAVGIVATDAAGLVLIFNRAAERILGHRAAEVVGRLTLDAIGRPGGGERHPLVRPAAGEEFWFDAQGNEHLLDIRRNEIRDPEGQRRGALVTFIDVTERRRLEAELALNELKLIQSAKMATLGEMATGVAHEINQPLNNIALLASRVGRRLTQLPLETSEREFFDEKLGKVRDQVERASKIITHLRTFGHATARQLRSVKLQGVVEGVLVFLGEQLKGHGIDVELDLPPDTPPVLADEAQLEQVLLNLLINARDALDGVDRPDKRVLLTAARTTLEQEPAVRLTVKDNGPGIPPEQLPRVFDPFFTTKEVGKGTGLGLSISYGLVREFGGSLDVESQPGQGATFSIVLREGPPEPEVAPAAV